MIDTTANIDEQLQELEKIKSSDIKDILIVLNKTDLKSNLATNFEKSISISAKNNTGINELKNLLLDFVNTSAISNNDTIVTNLRHFDELQLTLHEINTIIEGLNNGLTGDFLAVNIRQALFHLGSITGEVTTDTLLGNIFSRFCIGK